MENRVIEQDIQIVYVPAELFPEGILEAHEKLHVHVPFSPERKFYGLSRPENGRGIVYKAGAEVRTPDEAKELKLDTMIIPSGNYIAETVHNFKEDALVIGRTFQRLLRQPNLDPQGYCVEWYLPNDRDVVCMIRVKD